MINVKYFTPKMGDPKWAHSVLTLIMG